MWMTFWECFLWKHFIFAVTFITHGHCVRNLLCIQNLRSNWLSVKFTVLIRTQAIWLKSDLISRVMNNHFNWVLLCEVDSFLPACGCNWNELKHSDGCPQMCDSLVMVTGFTDSSVMILISQILRYSKASLYFLIYSCAVNFVRSWQAQTDKYGMYSLIFRY